MSFSITWHKENCCDSFRTTMNMPKINFFSSAKEVRQMHPLRTKSDKEQAWLTVHQAIRGLSSWFFKIVMILALSQSRDIRNNVFWPRRLFIKIFHIKKPQRHFLTIFCTPNNFMAFLELLYNLWLDDLPWKS